MITINKNWKSKEHSVVVLERFINERKQRVTTITI